MKKMDSKKREGESIGDWIKRVAVKDSGWLEKAKWRQENRYWLDQASRIAIEVLCTIREKNITKEEFEEMCGFPLGRTLNGDRDLTLSQICKMQDVLGIKLIDIKFNFEK